MDQLKYLVISFVLLSCIPVSTLAAPENIRISQSAKTIGTYDFLEVTLTVSHPDAVNPFTDVSVNGKFKMEGGSPVMVDGFCDSEDGSTCRIRFMPNRPGQYTGSVHFRQGNFTESKTVSFSVKKSPRRGPVRVDREHPFHFVWEGTGEHYFWNSTTAYALIGWRDEEVIRESIDRLHRLKINRIRAAVFPPRVKGADEWSEPTVMNDSLFSFLSNPWVAAHPESVNNPDFDVRRFNVKHWQKFDRLLEYARGKDMVVSVIFYVSGFMPGNYPFKNDSAGQDEKRYYQYAVARFGAYSNVMWDLSNEYNLFRDNEWAEKMGTFLKECDPYDHLTSVHHNRDNFNFRKSPWVDFALYQSWDEKGGYNYMMHNRKEQIKLERPMPQINEEYGYEDHYPPYEGNRKYPSRSSDNRRRLAWEISMAGCYQTTGERANEPGYGGWTNGRGNDKMVMLRGYAHMRDFFEGFSWWKLQPHPEIVDKNTLCLAEPGKRYVLYFPKGGTTNANVLKGWYRAKWYNPREGKYVKKMKLLVDSSQPFTAPDTEDWVLTLERQNN